jgi:ubiquinone biosynthesis protein
MRRFYRGIFIVWVALRYGLDELVLTSFQKPWLRVVARSVSIGRNLDAPRGQRLREALERLGPIFVKFGQVLSTRRDLLPPDIADELALLQDQVAPFDGALARAEVERALGKPVSELYASFDTAPLASASIAQVHAATLHDGRQVVVKVLRPNVRAQIDADIALLNTLAAFADRHHPGADKIRPRAVVSEIETTLEAELEAFYDDVDALRERVERLIARVGRITPGGER